MRKLGPPTIEVVDCGAAYAALEGSHRLAAAELLGVAPRLVVRSRSEVIHAPAYDWFDEGFFPELDCTAGVAVDRLHRLQAPVYRYA